jgi:hypothetical protein
MRNRRVILLAITGALGLILLLAACTSANLAVRAGLAPVVDWKIQIGDYRILLIHNGPTTTCYGLRDSCRRRLVRHEFYVHYITPSADRVLIWVPTAAP